MDFKTIFIENYELILGCVKAGMGKAYVSKQIIDKYAYTDDLILTKIPKEPQTHLICRKDYIPMISDYLKKVKLN